MFAVVTIPFEGPDLYARPGFGAAVTRGEQFTVRLCDGSLLTNPRLADL